ncbi:MAG: hypothetical protein ACKOJF_01080, partial [Planctomycetaceae bacterium]
HNAGLAPGPRQSSAIAARPPAFRPTGNATTARRGPGTGEHSRIPSHHEVLRLVGNHSTAQVRP